MTSVTFSNVGLKLDAPSPGDIVTVRIKPRPKRKSHSGHSRDELGVRLGRDLDEDEATNAQHYRMNAIFKVIATNGGHAVVERMTGWDIGRRDTWPIALHDWYEASELLTLMNGE